MMVQNTLRYVVWIVIGLFISFVMVSSVFAQTPSPLPSKCSTQQFQQIQEGIDQFNTMYEYLSKTERIADLQIWYWFTLSDTFPDCPEGNTIRLRLGRAVDELLISLLYKKSGDDDNASRHFNAFKEAMKLPEIKVESCYIDPDTGFICPTPQPIP